MYDDDGDLRLWLWFAAGCLLLLAEASPYMLIVYVWMLAVDSHGR